MVEGDISLRPTLGEGMGCVIETSVERHRKFIGRAPYDAPCAGRMASRSASLISANTSKPGIDSSASSDSA